MAPPLTPSGFANQAAPLSQWQNADSYPDARSCKVALQQGQFAAAANFGQIQRAANQAETYAVESLNARCVSSADPGFSEGSSQAGITK